METKELQLNASIGTIGRGDFGLKADCVVKTAYWSRMSEVYGNLFSTSRVFCYWRMNSNRLLRRGVCESSMLESQ